MERRAGAGSRGPRRVPGSAGHDRIIMFLSTQPYKGTRDFYPAEMRVQRYIFDKMRRVAESYGYLEYDGPLLEPFELYAAKSGEELVNKQLYWLIDRGERKLA